MKNILVFFLYIVGISLSANNLEKGIEEVKKENFILAVNYFTKSCNSGNYTGCYNLAISYNLGEGVDRNESKSITLFQKSCDNDISSACGKLAYLYEYETKQKVSRNKIKSLYEKSCKGGFGEGCNNLGVLYYRGTGVKRSYSEATKLYEKACSLKYSRGCENTGLIYAKGIVGKIDLIKSKEYFYKSCVYSDISNRNTCKKYGAILEHFKREGLKLTKSEQAEIIFRDGIEELDKTGDKTNNKVRKAISLYKDAVKDGELGSTLSLAYIYIDGIYDEKQDIQKALKYSKIDCDKGVVQSCKINKSILDLETAIKSNKKDLDIGEKAYEYGFISLAKRYYIKSCKKNNQEGCVKLAGMYLTSRNKSEYEKGIDINTKACKEQNGKACERLAIVYAFGLKDIKADEKKSIDLYKLACKYKEGSSCRQLGDSFLRKDKKEAFKYYEKACKLNTGCDNLGDFYAKGEVVKKDEEHAKEIFKSSCDNNNSKACYKLGDILLGSSSKIDFKEIQKYYKKSCKLTDRTSFTRYDKNKACELYPKIDTFINLSQLKISDMKMGLLSDELGFYILGNNYYKKACKLNIAKACDRVGSNYFFGMANIKEDKKKGMEYYDIACKLKNSGSCSFLGDRYKEKDFLKSRNYYKKECLYEEESVSCHEYFDFKPNLDLFSLKNINKGIELFSKKDYTKAMDFFKKDCSEGHIDSCNNLGMLSTIVDSESKNSKEIFKSACDNNNYKSCFNLGSFYYEKEEYLLAKPLFEKACENGNGNSCMKLAWMYDGGKGVKKDSHKEVEYTQKSCDNNYAHACSGLACMYRHGMGYLNRNSQKAKELHKKACKLGVLSSCDTIKEIDIFLNKLYHKKNKGLSLFLIGEFKKSFIFYKKLCEDGDLYSCNNLGVIYTLEDKGIDYNKTKAKEIFKNVCENKLTKGCINLANILTRKDQDEKGILYSKACDNGDLNGCEKAKSLYRRDAKKAYILDMKACKLGGAESCLSLGRIESKKDLTKAIEFYNKACKFSYRKACDSIEPYKEWFKIERR